MNIHIIFPKNFVFGLTSESILLFDVVMAGARLSVLLQAGQNAKHEELIKMLRVKECDLPISNSFNVIGKTNESFAMAKIKSF
jgi:hypothetical protein